MRPLSVWRDFSSGLYRSRAEVGELRLARLRALVEHAYAKVPYYRKLFDRVGFQPRHLKQLSDIEAIPVTTRLDLQSTPLDDLIARGYAPERLRPSRTSGSTGAPLTVYRSQREAYFGRFARMRMWLYHGIRLNDRVLTICGRPTTIHRRPWLRFLPVPWRWNLSVLERPDTILAALAKFRPSVLYGYSSHVAQLARLAREGEIPGARLRVVATSGDLLPPGFRKLIREAWDVDPIDIYNSSEIGDIGWQFKARQGFHLNADVLVVEFLRDGRPVQDGDRGEIAITNLYRYAMPLIRYNGGDLGVPGDDPCDCGIRLPKMRAIEGRTLNACPLPDGRWFIGFNRIMSNIEGIARFQVLQKALDQFQVGVVPGAGYSPDVLARIEHDVRARLGEGIGVEVRQVLESELVQTSGKLAAVIPFARMDFGNAEGP